MSLYELLLTVLLLFISYYLMDKSFSYQNGTFYIASNLYQDLGVHIPMIRSFSLGYNRQPVIPFFSEHPLTYHYVFDFLVAVYEKSGIRLVDAFNVLSCFSMTAVLILIHSLSGALFGRRNGVGALAVLLFFTNSTTSFIEAFQKYGLHIRDYYHHSMYLGNGPFGDNVVSVFWNMNTYLNQRHFLFSIGITLFVTICLITVINKPVPFRSRVFLGVLIGLLPFWNSAVYIATLIISFGIGIQSDRKRWASYIPMVVPALLIALPQIVFIGTYTQHAFKFNPGFLVTDSFVSWLFYWVRNFGISLVTVPLGIYFSTKKSRILVLPFLLLFLVANLFQFSFEMASNHKFINMMILFANLYSAFCIVFLWKHGVAVKIVTGVFLFFLIVSGVLDLLVVKNDVKATIVDYPGNPFMSWVVNRTKPTDIFVTNGDIYDPVTISGRKTTTGRAHTAFTYGIDTKEDVLLQREVLEGLIEVPNKYIAVYVDTHIPTQQIVVNTERLRDLYQTVYADTSVTVYHK